ncbi:multidrug ABC transporter permease [Pilimelia terevasa]|uniref:Multidrug ABC transporter permease n=1 Tax=Pilimelia terevasa TaxID=53372 RepID=A0A8J3BPA0_9ACTN|nr:multidrug ABC transporter permease [Pilimelia terevasa]
MPADPAGIPHMSESGWLKHTDTLAGTSFAAVARRLPGTIRQALGIAWVASRIDTAAALLLNLLTGVATAFGLLATQSVLQQLFAAGPTPERVRAAVPALAAVACTVALRSGLGIAAGWAQSRLEPRVVDAVERRLYTATTLVDVAAYDDPDFADETFRSRQRSSISAQYLVRASIDLTAGAAGLVGTAVALLLIHPLLFAALAAASVPGAWTAIRVGRLGYLVDRLLTNRRRRMWLLAEVMATRTAGAEVRAFTARDYLLGEYATVAEAQTRAEVDTANVRSTIRLIGGIASGIATAGVYVLLGFLLADDVIPLAAAGTAVLALQAARQSTALALVNINKIYEESLYFGDYLDFAARAAALTSPPHPGPVAAPARIDARQVSLQYPDSDRLALDKVTVTARRGETIALVGENGSGKTTLAKLLAGLYRPTDGTIEWNGTPLTGGGEAVWRHVALVPQEHVRWPFTARTNITIGSPTQDGPDELAVERAAVDSGAHEVITALPAGYDTLLSRGFAGGVDLSGGQWQRIACARAFYRDAPLLICDEPSAALDARAEHALFTALRANAERRITVLVTHRLANVRHADRIYVIHEGHLVEEGTHQQLMAADGRYAELFQLQAAGYLDADAARVPAQVNAARAGQPDKPT